MSSILNIDIKQSKDWGLSAKQAILFSWLFERANERVYPNNFFAVSKKETIKFLPILTDKIDTIYRMYKSLEAKGLIEIKKDVTSLKYDLIKMTPKSKLWLS